MSNTGRSVAVEVVDKTTAWTRPAGCPSENVKDSFAATVQQNADTFKAGVVTVAMKESEHPSPSDKNDHYTAYGLDQSKQVIDVQHLPKS